MKQTDKIKPEGRYIEQTDRIQRGVDVGREEISQRTYAKPMDTDNSVVEAGGNGRALVERARDGRNWQPL